MIISMHLEISHLSTCMFVTVLHRGFGESYQLGHGDKEHVRTPKLIQALEDHTVTDVSIGMQHCMALTSEGMVFAWGKNSAGEVNGSDDIVSEPVLIEEVSGKGTVAISCGANEVLSTL